jgi:4a-hydroxytetrahydrobiopterin dehydratase
MAKYRTLTDAEIESALQELKDWSLAGSKLKAAFVFASFREAVAFLVRVAFEAEALDHHPELGNVYSRVSFMLSTHDAGDRVSDLDVELARRISTVARGFARAG